MTVHILNLNVLSILVLLCSMVQNSLGFFDDTWYMIPPIGKITVYSVHLGNASIFTVLDQPAAVKYESQIPSTLEGVIVPASPINACKRLAPVPRANHYHEGNILAESSGGTTLNTYTRPNWILLAVKSDCNYQTKVEYAHAAGYSGIIIYNSGSNETEVIEFDEEGDETSGMSQAYPILIPAYFVGEHDGQILRKKYSANPAVSERYDFFVKIETKSTFFEEVIIYILWGLFGVFFLAIAVCLLRPLYLYLIQPWCRKKYEDRKRFLLTRAVKSLPVFQWKEEMIEKHDKCPICLDTYKTTDVLRNLPCSHCFHVHCIDKWLLKVRRNCPICKTKLVYSRCFEEFTDSEISEGNYFTGNIRSRPSTTSVVTIEEEIFDDDDDDEFDPAVQSVLNTRTLNEERNWSSTSSSDSGSCESIYTACTSTEEYPTSPSTSTSSSSGGSGGLMIVTSLSLTTHTSLSHGNANESNVLIECSVQVHEHEESESRSARNGDNENEHDDYVVIHN